MSDFRIIQMDIANIKPYENNPRFNDKAVDAVANSIENFGFKVPIVVDKNNVIVTGHTRLKAAKKLGLAQVPVIVADDLTPEKIKAFRLADNKVSELADWDFSKLEAELAGLEMDMTQFNFDMKELLKEFDKNKEVVEDDFDIDTEVEKIEEPTVKRGQVWKLGDHYLMCGDSTSKEDVSKLMNKSKADLVFTDPPYGMKKENEGVLNDNLNYNALLNFNGKWIPLAFECLTDVGSWYCWGIDEPLMDIYANILKPMQNENKITFRNLITWDKGNGQGQMSDDFRMYPIADEKCLFVMKGVQGFNTNADNYFEGWENVRQYLETEIKKIGESDQKIANALGYKDGRTINHYWNKSQWQFPTKENYKKLQEYAKSKGIEIFKREYEDIKREYEDIKREYYSTRAYFDNTHDNMNNVWHFMRTNQKERELTGGHATPKPIELCARAILTSSREGDTVLDLFGGSGSTLIACEQLNRRCYTMELDPKYCDVILKRYITLKGNSDDVFKMNDDGSKTPYKET